MKVIFFFSNIFLEMFYLPFFYWKWYYWLFLPFFFWECFSTVVFMEIVVVGDDGHVRLDGSSNGTRAVCFRRVIVFEEDFFFSFRVETVLAHGGKYTV